MRQWTVDAFASRPFMGNPACVVEPFDNWPQDDWMQSLAAENNQAETAYLRRTEAAARFELRWFTPAVEVPLCGHATLASAHILFEELGLEGARLTFDTRRSGALGVDRAAAAEGAGYVMDFPAGSPQRIAPPAGLSEALGIAPIEVWSGAFLAATLESETAVRGLTPDLSALKCIGEGAQRGNLIVTTRADAGRPYDVVSRVFAPGSGIPEDPATGSAHCLLAPLYAMKLGRLRNRFHQAYPGRGGDLVCEVRGERVLIQGEAVTVLESRLRL